MFCKNVRFGGEVNWLKKSLFSNEVIFNKHQGLWKRSFQDRRAGRTRIWPLRPDKIALLAETERPLQARGLFRPFIFTIGVSTASVIGCSIWQYEQQRNRLNYNRHKYRNEGPLSKWWNSLRESEKVYLPILGANLLVFGAWRIRSLGPTLVKYFCSNPSGPAVCMPMVLSTFSHYSFLHLAANMYVLYSFMPAAVMSMGKEQFLAMYLSAGVFSSLTSFLYKIAIGQTGLSLGASGAIMGVLAYVCMQYPDTKLSIIFLPMYTFAAGSAIKFIMGADLAGVLLGWRFFDHAAHLGGALFGIAWCYWGREHIWGNRDKILRIYHDIRTARN